MPLIMIVYYVICLFIAGMLVWNFIREKDDRQMMVLYLVVLVPLVLRILRID
jgi:tryptophan-rich sensory protein